MLCVSVRFKTNSTDDNITTNPQLSHYQLVYGMLGVVMVVLAVIDCFIYTWVTLNAASRLHNNLFKKVKPERLIVIEISLLRTLPNKDVKPSADYLHAHELFRHDTIRANRQPVLQRPGGGGHRAAALHGQLHTVLPDGLVHHSHHLSGVSLHAHHRAGPRSPVLRHPLVSGTISLGSNSVQTD